MDYGREIRESTPTTLLWEGDRSPKLHVAMNQEAKELLRVIAEELPELSFQFESNDLDPQTKPGSVRVSTVSRFDSTRELVLLQRGDTVEVAYYSGGSSVAGPAERQFIFDRGEESEGIQAAVMFAKAIVTEQIIVLRKKYWLSKKAVLSFMPAAKETRYGHNVAGVESWLGNYDLRK